MSIKVNVTILGNLKHQFDLRKLESWKSKLFTVHVSDNIQALPDTEGDDWSYTDDQLAELLNHNPDFAYTVGIINAPIQDNYYIRRLGDNRCVLSLYETGEILGLANISLENFVLRNIYEFCCFYHELGQKVPGSVYTLTHDETRNCLFDMNANKFDIVYSTEKPRICESCRARIMAAQVPRNFLNDIDKELKKLKKALYLRILDFIKSHPLWSIAISILGVIVLNLFSSYLFRLFTGS